MLPKHWPLRLIYSHESISREMHHSLLRNLLCSKKQENFTKTSKVIERKCIHPDIEIQLITPSSHPHHPLCHLKISKEDSHRGLFATKTIPKGTELGEYVGELYIRTPEYFTQKHLPRIAARSSYVWHVKINKIFSLLIDAQLIANELALVNDYRGIQSHPNVKMKPIVHLGYFYFGYVTLCDIKQGQEIVVDYGESFWKNS